MNVHPSQMPWKVQPLARARSLIPPPATRACRKPILSRSRGVITAETRLDQRSFTERRRLVPSLRASASGSEMEVEALRDTPVLDRVQFGVVSRIFSEEELETILREYPEHLVVLKCKAKYCRPCQAFAKKFIRFAEEFTDVLFLEIVGDENKKTRMMMIDFEVKATPTFRYYAKGEYQLSTVGIKQEKVRAAILDNRPQKTLPQKP